MRLTFIIVDVSKVDVQNQQILKLKFEAKMIFRNSSSSFFYKPQYRLRNYYWNFKSTNALEIGIFSVSFRCASFAWLDRYIMQFYIHSFATLMQSRPHQNCNSLDSWYKSIYLNKFFVRLLLNTSKEAIKTEKIAKSNFYFL